MEWLGALLAAAAGVCGSVSAIGEVLEGDSNIAGKVVDATIKVTEVIFLMIKEVIGWIVGIVVVVAVIGGLFPSADLTHTRAYEIFHLAGNWIIWISAGLGASLVVFLLFTTVVSAAVIQLNENVGSKTIKFVGLILGAIGGLILFFNK
jgi:hypothetical protein